MLCFYYATSKETAKKLSCAIPWEQVNLYVHTYMRIYVHVYIYMYQVVSAIPIGNNLLATAFVLGKGVTKYSLIYCMHAIVSLHQQKLQLNVSPGHISCVLLPHSW